MSLALDTSILNNPFVGAIRVVQYTIYVNYPVAETTGRHDQD